MLFWIRKVQTITNTATVSSEVFDPNEANNSWEIYTPIDAYADLKIEKQGPATVIAGETITYTITVTNDGPNDATGVVAIDNINPAYILNPVYFNGTDWVAWTGNLNIGTLANNASFTFTISGKVASNISVNSIPNTAQVTSNLPDPDPSNNTSSITTPVTRAS
jgi:uncharacterized repeat protein (TIGR01451 family)